MRTKQRTRKERGCDETGRYAGSPTDAATVTAVTNSNNTQHLKDKTKEGTQINIAIALCVCVCACVCAHVCTCVCACVHGCVHVCVSVHVKEMLAQVVGGQQPVRSSREGNPSTLTISQRD